MADFASPKSSSSVLNGFHGTFEGSLSASQSLFKGIASTTAETSRLVQFYSSGQVVHLDLAEVTVYEFQGSPLPD
jgi:hypothetical protein